MMTSQGKGLPVSLDELRGRTNLTESGCWEWTGAVRPAGYGQISSPTTTHAAHRVAYELANGAVPAGMLVLHSCDNRLCCNPDHLRAGTAVENSADMMKRGRHRFVTHSGEANGRAKLTAAQVAEIRASDDSHAALGRLYDVSPTTIRMVRRGLVWTAA